MRIDVTLTFPSTDEKIAAECKSTSWCKSHAPRRMRSGGRYSGRFATTVDYVAKKARIDRGDKADLIDNEGFEGRPTIRRALATLGTAAACCCLCRCLGLLYAKLLRLLQLRCSPTATSFFHSQKVVLKVESKQKGQTRSIRMEDFLSWGQFFT